MLAAACGGGGSEKGDDTGTHDGGVGDATMLPDDGPCTPGATRCNVNTPETCSADGTMWMPGTACTTFCQDGTCALSGLDVASDMTLEGTIVVSGAVTVHSGATLSSATGVLTIEADSISVENGGSISVAATGSDASEAGFESDEQDEENGGGHNSLTLPTNSDVFQGGPGGIDAFTPTLLPGAGGGVLRLIAKTSITMAGTVTADGGNGAPSTQNCIFGTGGGGGGGILLVADTLTVTGSLSAAGGLGGPAGGTCTTESSEAGDPGFVKLLYGSTNNTSTAVVTGTKVNAVAPPIPLTSTSHPDQTAVYNDGFLSLDMAWTKSFPTAMGYYAILNTTKSDPPTAATGTFLGTNKVSFPSSMVNDGDNYVHVVSVDSQSAISTVESVFHIAINTVPPGVTSSSHPVQTMFYSNTNPFFSWTYPQGDDQVTNAYYVFDHFGDTVPAITDTKLPASQKQLQQTNVAAGVWVLHVVAADAQGRLTKIGGNFRVNIGSSDPGLGSVEGTIVDSTQAGVAGATVTINRGLFNATTTSGGTYSFGTTIPAGTWELKATMGALTASKMITVTASTVTTGNLTIQ